MISIDAKKNVLGTLYLLVLVINSGFIAYTEEIYIKTLFSVMQGWLLIGVLEAVHQCTHQNFFTSRRANKIIGMFLGMGILIHFVRYRFFHAHHHAYTATPKDPERSLYLGGAKYGLFAFVLAPYSYFYFVYVVFASRYVAHSHVKSEHLNTVLYIAILAVLLAGSVWKPMLFLFHYWLPLSIFSWLDYLFNQAEHYGSTEITEASDSSYTTNDLLLPRFISALILFRNFHRVHHLSPTTPWFRMPSEYRANGFSGMPFRYFLRKYFRDGPRRWGMR